HGYDAYLTASGPVLALNNSQVDANGNPAPRDALGVQFVGGDPHALAYGQNQLTGFSNYFIGNQSITNVPNYAGVTYHVYPGIDVVYQGASGRNLEYSFHVQPGADVSQIQLAFTGEQSLSVDGSGNLDIQTPSGTVVMQAPVATQSAVTSTSATVSSDQTA